MRNKFTTDKHFLTYEQARALGDVVKNIGGFDEPCFGLYNQIKEDKLINKLQKRMSTYWLL